MKNKAYIKNSIFLLKIKTLIKLSVIIVNYKVPFFLEQCLLSVQVALKNISSEIIVVDNNSRDESCAMIKEKFGKVKLIENKENFGFSKANNIGVNAASGEFILILNPDTVIAEDTLDKVIRFAEKQKNLGAVGIKFIDGTGNFLPECKRNIPTVKIANQKIRGNSKKYYAHHIDENDISKVEILTGAFMLMKRKVYLNVGGFDEDYFMFGEDIDLSYKLLNKGFYNYYFGESTLIHYKGESTVKDLSYLKNFYGAMQIFYKKHYKENALISFISEVAVKSMVLLKSSSRSKEISKNRIIHTLLVICNNNETVNKIKNKIKPDKVKVRDVLPKDCTSFDMIIFDNSFLTNKEIMDSLIKLRSENISIRIIPKSTSFFIGSDSSTGRGEVILF